ncbi:MAG: sulfur oxidation c-type cytochrome SoxX [Candidatus Odyssella sp.]|nr:sulfur oxidation c-type cytochrome SoxX [Candidatus Odyssella sp.]
MLARNPWQRLARGHPSRRPKRAAPQDEAIVCSAKKSLILRCPRAFARASKDGCILGAAIAALAFATDARAQESLAPYAVVGDGIPASLTGVPGDPARGRAIVANRQVGLCILCHSGPFPEIRLQGDLAPDLRGAGRRWSEAQLRLRIVDTRRLNPDSIMPPYYRIDGLERVAAAWRGKPILTAAQIEDVVAYLLTLRDGP